MPLKAKKNRIMEPIIFMMSSYLLLTFFLMSNASKQMVKVEILKVISKVI